MTDLFTLAIEQRDARIAELEEQLIEARLALASALGYMRSNRVATGFQGLGVRKLMQKQIERKAA